MKKKITIGIIAAAVVVVLLLVFLGPGLSRKNKTEKDIIIAEQTSEEETQESVSEAVKTESEQTDRQEAEETDITKEETEPENTSAADGGSAPAEGVPSENNTEEVAVDPEEDTEGLSDEGVLPVLPAVVDGADDGESYETEEVPIN